MLSTVFEIIGMITVGAVAALLTMVGMGWVIMCAGTDEDDDITMFGFCWGFDSDDEFL